MGSAHHSEALAGNALAGKVFGDPRVDESLVGPSTNGARLGDERRDQSLDHLPVLRIRQARARRAEARNLRINE